jgi:hypothetical protein
VNEKQRLIAGHIGRYRTDLAARAYIEALETQRRIDDAYPAGGVLRSTPDVTHAEMERWSHRQKAADQAVRDTLAALRQAVSDGR